MGLNARIVRRMILVVLLAVCAYVGWLLFHMKKMGTVEVHEEKAVPGTLPSKPQEEMGCFDDLVLDWNGDRLEAGRACKQSDGFSQLERVTLIVRKSDGSEEMTVKAAHGRTAESPTEPITLTGDVHVTTPKGLSLTGEELIVDKGVQQVRSEKPVEFSQGDLSGHGGKLVHDWKNGRTVLESDPELRIAGQKTQGREITLVGQRLDYDQKARRLAAQGAGILDFPEGSIEGNDIDVVFAEGVEEVRTITATGSAQTKTTVAGGGPGGAATGPPVERILRAPTIVHEFGAGGALDRVTADGGARLDGRSVDEAAGILEVLEGTKLDLDFAGTQQVTLAGLEAEGQPAHFHREEPGAMRDVSGKSLQLTSGSQGFDRLVADGDANVHDESGLLVRTLVARKADIGFAPGGASLKSLAFEGSPARLAETPRQGAARPPGQAAPVARTLAAKTGDLRFDATGQPIAGTMQGQVEILDGAARASADKATLEESPRRTILEGHGAVEREGRTSHGDRIVLEREAGRMTVTGNQHTLVHDSGGIPGMASAGSDEPILISSDSLVLDDKKRTAEYEGGRPSLRRGDTELVADRLLLDDVAGSMDAWGDVQSRLRLAKPGTAKQATDSPFDPTRLVDGRGKEFHYRRSDAVVTYLGAASLRQEDSVLTADRVDIRLTSTEPAQVKSLQATGAAFFKAPTRGEAEGERITWQAADDSFRVFAGSRPARAMDAQGNFQTGEVVEMTKSGVHALSSSTGRARGSSPAVKVPGAEGPSGASGPASSPASGGPSTTKASIP